VLLVGSTRSWVFKGLTGFLLSSRGSMIELRSLIALRVMFFFFLCLSLLLDSEVSQGSKSTSNPYHLSFFSPASTLVHCYRLTVQQYHAILCTFPATSHQIELEFWGTGLGPLFSCSSTCCLEMPLANENTDLDQLYVLFTTFEIKFCN
jgi:hypothetical protein